MPEVFVEGVTKTYGEVKALVDANLAVRNGEYITIVGPSGCGKTTLLRSIAGIVQPDVGEVKIDGTRVTHLPIEERGVGYVFQEIALFPHMNIYDNVSYGLMVKGAEPAERKGPVDEMLSMMNLTQYGRWYPSELSGGAKQKTAISRALTSGATLLLLDEPLGALDLKVRTQLRYELRRLVKDLGLTVIHVTHDQEEALSVSDRIVVMKAGRIVEAGPPQQLYMEPQQIFTAKFLGEANFMEGRVEGIGEHALEVEVGGSTLQASVNNGVKAEKSSACVLAIRPEFVELSIKPGERNCWRGRVTGQAFVGDAIRYEFEAENGVRLLIKAQLTGEAPEIREGDEACAALFPEHLLAYPYPEEGLEKALSLE